MSELYKAIAGSPITYLATDVSAGQTTIAVTDDSVLPDAPNICTIGYGENIETIRYGAKSNGVLQDVTRGIEGTPRAWQSGTEVARFYTAYDHNAIIQTIMTHKAESAAKHIAESGSNANGRYIKFDDGTMIQWGEKNFTQSVKYAWGALYVASGEPCTVDFPLTFIETPIIIASPRTTGNASAFFGNYNAIRVYQSSVQYLVQAFRPTESDSVAFVVHWVAIGRWK
jgi:hypothetical protein